jgi:acyl-coenzyme A thioesterase PaaI-like protein
MTPPAATQDFIALAFSAQRPLLAWQARIDAIRPAEVEISMPITDAITTFNGAVVGGVIATLADVAAGLGLIALLDAPRPVITLDFNSQQLAPAIGARLIAVGVGERAGRSIGFASAQAFVEVDGARKRVARLCATFQIPA